MILHRIRVAIALLCLLAWSPAYAQKTPAQIRTDINTLFPDNDQNRITPFDLRFVTTEMTSAYLPVTSVIPSANIPPATNGALGGVFAVACASNLWIQTITTGTGSPVCTQINFSNLAGVASAGQIAAGPASHATPIDVAGTPTWSVVPNCLDSSGQHVNYTQSTDAWSCGTSTNAGPGVGSVDNLLPNVQMQQWTGNVITVKQNATGTGPQTPASCASFSTANGAPTFLCANTQQIKIGDLIVVATAASFTTAAYDNFWGYAGAGYISCNAGTVQCTATAGTTVSCTSTHFTCYITAARVIGVVTNTSITIQGYLGAVSPVASSATFLYPVSRGNDGDGFTLTADNWAKTGSLVTFPDDFTTHAYPGAIRVLHTRKGITGAERVYYTIPTPNQIGRYAGQTLSCGVTANQTVQGGANTWNISIIDNIGSTVSANGSGVSAGGYQFESVTRAIPQNITSIVVQLNSTGNSGDVIYWALPTCAFIPSLVQSQLHQNSSEYIVADGHCNPPILTPLIIQFNANLGGPFYGWTGIDLEAISIGCWHSSIGGVMAKVEWQTSTVGAILFLANDITFSSFGPQVYTQVTGVINWTGGLMRLTSQGYFMMTTATANLVPTQATFDIWDGVTSAPNPLH